MSPRPKLSRSAKLQASLQARFRLPPSPQSTLRSVADLEKPEFLNNLPPNQRAWAEQNMDYMKAALADLFSDSEEADSKDGGKKRSRR